MHELITSGRFIFFDGAMGTMLQRAGLDVGDFPEVYTFSKPEVVSDIYRQYRVAGADILTTNTFSSNDYKLKGRDFSVDESVSRGVTVARGASEQALVALDIGPIGQLMQPMGSLSFEDAYSMFSRQVQAGVRAGADLVIIETMSDLYEVKAAVLAVKENSRLPVICTLTFQKDGRTLAGADALTAVTVLEALGVDALGMNCSLGPAEMIPIAREFLKYARLPVIVQPNAGMPRLVDGETVYSMTPAAFAEQIRIMAGMGVRIFGGCCGTNPDFILQSRAALGGSVPVVTSPVSQTRVASGCRTVVIDERTVIIGERINPTGKKKLKEALRSRNLDYILGEAVSQRDAGADILDINCGLPEIDELEMMVRIVQEVQAIVELPLQIDSTRPEVIEAAARVYNGKPLINSVSGEQASLKAILPIVRRYGACVLGLTLDERGIPESAEGRFAVAQKIVAAADGHGIPREDVLIDCLVLTASAQQSAVMETLRAMRMVKERLGVKTILGVSNVSFGLPRRDCINRTFLGMALACGLDAPILNPLSAGMMETVHAYRVLANRDPESRDFIRRYADSQAPADSAPPVGGQAAGSDPRSLQDIVISGLRDRAAAKTAEMLEQYEPMRIIEDHLMPALEVVGRRYEKGELFLPQLIQAAETVKRAFEILKEKLSAEDSRNMSRGAVLLATVKGDIHDIGKNIVKVLLENHGYDVLDLGKDVAPDQIIAEARRHGITLVGLSALMTTTLKSMQDTIAGLQQEHAGCRVMVGGAVLNRDYAEMIKADFYAPDAQSAVGIAKKHFGR